MSRPHCATPTNMLHFFKKEVYHLLVWYEIITHTIFLALYDLFQYLVSGYRNSIEVAVTLTNLELYSSAGLPYKQDSIMAILVYGRYNAHVNVGHYNKIIIYFHWSYTIKHNVLSPIARCHWINMKDLASDKYLMGPYLQFTINVKYRNNEDGAQHLINVETCL